MATFGTYFEDIDTLKSSSEAASKADDIIENSDITACAMLINTSANAGQHSALWQHPMSDELRSALESNGYEIEELRHVAKHDELWVIKW